MQKNKILRRLTAFLLSAVFLFTGVAQTFAWNPNEEERCGSKIGAQYLASDGRNYMLNISYKKTIAAFRELIDKGLLYEKRQGRGYPNLLYVLKAELNDTDASNFAQKYDETSDESTAEAPSSPHNTQTCQNDRSRHSDSAHQDLSKSQFKICQNDTLRTAVSEDPELPKVHPIKNNNKYIEMSYLDNQVIVAISKFNYTKKQIYGKIIAKW